MYAEQMIPIIESFAGICETLQERKNILLDELSRYDTEIDAILHRIEYTKFNASEGYKTLKALQNLRVERRHVKKQLAALNCFNDTWLQHNKTVGVTLYKVSKKLTKENLGGTDYECVDS